MLNVRRFIDGATASKASALILTLSEPVIPGKAAGRGPESQSFPHGFSFHKVGKGGGVSRESV